MKRSLKVITALSIVLVCVGYSCTSSKKLSDGRETVTYHLKDPKLIDKVLHHFSVEDMACSVYYPSFETAGLKIGLIDKEESRPYLEEDPKGIYITYFAPGGAWTVEGSISLDLLKNQTTITLTAKDGHTPHQDIENARALIADIFSTASLPDSNLLPPKPSPAAFQTVVEQETIGKSDTAEFKVSSRLKFVAVKKAGAQDFPFILKRLNQPFRYGEETYRTIASGTIKADGSIVFTQGDIRTGYFEAHEWLKKFN